MSQDGFIWSGRLGDNEIRKSSSYDFSDFIPAKNLKITVDKEKVLANGTVSLKDSAKIVSEIKWTLNGEKSGSSERIYKNSMMVLDILANNNWERPVYFAVTVSHDNFLNLSDYFQMDGVAHRFVPIQTPSERYGELGRIDTEKLYDKMMNKFRWGNISDPSVYLDETNLRLLTHFRGNFARLAGELNLEGKKDSAILVLDRAFEVIPVYQLSYNYADISFVEQYFSAGAIDKGNELAGKMFETARKELNYYLSFPKKFANSLDREQQLRLYTLSSLNRMAKEYEQTELSEKFEKQMQEIMYFGD